jgi:hypothetical protein
MTTTPRPPPPQPTPTAGTADARSAALSPRRHVRRNHTRWRWPPTNYAHGATYGASAAWLASLACRVRWSTQSWAGFVLSPSGTAACSAASVLLSAVGGRGPIGGCTGKFGSPGHGVLRRIAMIYSTFHVGRQGRATTRTQFHCYSTRPGHVKRTGRARDISTRPAHIPIPA